MTGGKKGGILVGDIGGTKTRLAIVEILKGHFNLLAEETFPSREEPSLESTLQKFLSNPLRPTDVPAWNFLPGARETNVRGTGCMR